MRAIISVAGKDRTGIIAGVSKVLSDSKVNIEDISQTVMQGNFVMIMVVDLTDSGKDVTALAEPLSECAARLGVDIRIQHEDIFNTMHRI